MVWECLVGYRRRFDARGQTCLENNKCNNDDKDVHDDSEVDDDSDVDNWLWLFLKRMKIRLVNLANVSCTRIHIEQWNDTIRFLI